MRHFALLVVESAQMRSSAASVGIAMIVLALPKDGEARSFLNNSFISVIYLGTILTLVAFGVAFTITGAMSH